MLLEIKNITKSFDGIVAIKDLSMSFKEGELRCIIGPNGSGKTTLFNLITGYYKPTAGHVLYNGREITKTSVPRIVRMGICR